MYKITLPIDFNGSRYGIEFKRGAGVTYDPRIAGICAGKGFRVEPPVDAPEPKRGGTKNGKKKNPDSPVPV